MKRILSMVIPSLIVLGLILIDSTYPQSKYIILGIYFIFPLAFIVQGRLLYNSLLDMLIGSGLLVISIWAPILVFYNIRSIIIPLIVYLVLGFLSVGITRFVKSKNKHI
ncbi:MAG: hypothetical protein RR539_07600 [Clostridium sp.]|uniref:hypothetical protein n=1 Tax=Clostridium sp. TaxID=1506 RepID=UPI002FC6E478